MIIRYFNPITSKMEEHTVIAQGAVAYYIRVENGLKAIPKDEVGVKFETNISPVDVFKYIEDNKGTIEFVDFSMFDAPQS